MNECDVGIRLSAHARQRAAQRGLSLEDIALGLVHGEVIQRAGCTFVVVQDRDLPVARPHGTSYAKLAGLVLLIADSGQIITLYRRRRPLQHVLKKAKFENQLRAEAAATPWASDGGVDAQDALTVSLPLSLSA